jgi:CubicO group peptidase (beta-lactamase class C family)
MKRSIKSTKGETLKSLYRTKPTEYFRADHPGAFSSADRLGSSGERTVLKPINQATLQTMVDTTARELLIPGRGSLAHTQGEFRVSYGTTLPGASNPRSPDTRFRIASNTKTMTAAVIVLLAQVGKLSLDDPVSKYVPGVPNGDNITIAELLNMRSGLYTYDDGPDFGENGPINQASFRGEQPSLRPIWKYFRSLALSKLPLHAAPEIRMK